MLEYNVAIIIALGGILAIAITSTIINHRKKSKSKQHMCTVCGGVGFFMAYTSKPIPPCKRCNGTGYVLDEQD